MNKHKPFVEVRVAGVESSAQCADSKEAPEWICYPGKNVMLDQEPMTGGLKGGMSKASLPLPWEATINPKEGSAAQAEKDELRLLGAFLWTCAAGAVVVGIVWCSMVIIQSGL